MDPQEEVVPLTAEEELEAVHRARIGSMLGNSVFLEAVTLQLARELELKGSEKYFFEILRDGEGAPRIRDVVQLSPTGVEAMLASGEWLPQDLKEWKWLVLTAMREGVYPAMPAALERALAIENSPVRLISAGLLFDAERPLQEILREGFQNEDPNNRAYAALAVCANGRPDYAGAVRALLDDEHPWVRANAMAGLVAIGDSLGVQAARDLLFAPAAIHPARDISFLFEALERLAFDENVTSFVEELLPKLKGLELVAAQSLLVIHGVELDRTELRAALPGLDPLIPEMHRGVRALSTTLTAEDVGVLVGLFHQPNSQTVALDLVVALAKSGYGEVEALLQRAAFTLPWNQGILAAGCAIEAYGDEALYNWMQSAPEGTEPEVIRRLGWAIGTFGGAETVEALRERASHPELGLPPERRSVALQGAALALLAAGS